MLLNFAQVIVGLLEEVLWVMHYNYIKTWDMLWLFVLLFLPYPEHSRQSRLVCHAVFRWHTVLPWVIVIKEEDKNNLSTHDSLWKRIATHWRRHLYFFKWNPTFAMKNMSNIKLVMFAQISLHVIFSDTAQGILSGFCACRALITL